MVGPEALEQNNKEKITPAEEILIAQIRKQDGIIEELKGNFLRVLRIEDPKTPYAEIFYELGITQGKAEAYKEALHIVGINDKAN